MGRLFSEGALANKLGGHMETCERVLQSARSAVTPGKAVRTVSLVSQVAVYIDYSRESLCR